MDSQAHTAAIEGSGTSAQTRRELWDDRGTNGQIQGMTEHPGPLGTPYASHALQEVLNPLHVNVSENDGVQSAEIVVQPEHEMGCNGHFGLG